MSVIVRLQNLPWAANALDIRQYFHGLSIPEGGVHIVGGELGDAFIAFSTDEDARQAMLRDGGKVKEIKIRLFLSSRTEMQKIIDQARQQSLGMQQFMAMPTMPQMQVPVSNMTVPSMPVQNVTMPTVQNVPGMQVPLQNVPNVTTMVSHMVTKPNDNVITPPAAAPPPAIAVLPVQPEPAPAAPPSTTSSISFKGDSEKDKKDKRRRRTRSHSRGRSDSRSKSRSTSRSRSRSKDRKGRDRDRYYDRRRRRSRSRDRRRRRDRSRSRDRSSRDKRRDFRHGSREEADENSQQSGSNSNRWSQRNQQPKSRPEFFNRQQQNRNGSFGPRGPHNMNNLRPPFPNTNDNINQNKNLTPPPSMNISRLPATPVKDVNSPKQSPSLNIDSVSIPPTPVSDSKPSSNINSMSQSQNFFSGYPQNPPAFNPQEMVSYPTFNPSTGGSFNSGFSMPSPQQKLGNISKVNVEKSEISDKRKNMNDIKDTKPNQSQPFKHQTNSYPTKFNKDDSNSESIIPGISSEMKTDNIPLPDNSGMQKNNPAFGWGYGGGNYGYRNINSYDDFNKDESNPSSNYQESFQPPNWENPRESNRGSNKVQNTCVQIKSIPPCTTAEDIRAFFPNSNIPTGWLKILGGDNNSGVAYVRFTSIHDKKQAILRSGCLLKNGIVTVLHVDDSIYDNAVDTKLDYVSPSGFWNLNSREQAMENKQLQQQKLEQKKQIQPPSLINQQQQQLPPNPMIEPSHKEQIGNKNCIKIEGSVRFHPFYTHNHKMYPHIRSVCDKFNLLDVCVTNAGGDNINGFMKFDNSVNIENVLMSLSNAKVAGRPVIINGCVEEEFNVSKANCMPLDVQKFFETVRNQPKKSNIDPKSDKPNTKGVADFQGQRYKLSSESPREHHDDFNNDDDDDNMEIDDEIPTEPTRNKVLLPTPAGMMQQQPPYEANPIPPTNCVLINNLPFHANDHDILDFFSDIGVIPNQIHILLKPDGKPSGDAFCEFDKHEEAVKAATKNKCQMGYFTIFVCLMPRQEMEEVLGSTTQGPPPGPYFGGPPVGPPMFGNTRNNQPGAVDWAPAFQPSGPPQFDESDEYDDSYDMPPVSRGRGGRGRGGGRGFDRGGRSRERGRGSSRGFSSSYRGGGNPDMYGRSSSIRGSSSMRGSDRGMRISERGMRGSERGIRGSDRGMRGSDRGMRGSDRGMRGGDRGRGRGRGDREMRDESRPVPLMSLSAGPVMGSDAPVNLQEESVRDFGRPGCVVSVENVPFRATIDDILDFFRDFNLAPDCVIRRYDDVGKITGDARVAFESPSDARRAVKFLNYKTLLTRKISLSLFK